MLAYNLFLLFKMAFAKETEYRQQIKTFRLKYIFLAGKIIRTARSVVMKLSDKYLYREIYEQSLPWKNALFYGSTRYFYLKQAGKNISRVQFYEMDHGKWCKIEEIMLKLSEFSHNHHPSRVKLLENFIRRGI